MKTKLLYLLLTCIVSQSCWAQTVSPGVISPAGGSSLNGGAMLSSTVGEMTMVKTFSAADVILTQGFQQAYDINVGIHKNNVANNTITLGPNPSRGEVQLFFNSAAALNLTILIYDMAGKLIYQTTSRKAEHNNYILLNLSSLAVGDYLLNCNTASTSTEVAQSFSQKINIIK